MKYLFAVVPLLAGAIAAEFTAQHNPSSDLFGSSPFDKRASCRPIRGIFSCERSCGSGYETCAEIPNCYNPSAGESCCENGTYCPEGYYCTERGCCPLGRTLTECQSVRDTTMNGGGGSGGLTDDETDGEENFPTTTSESTFPSTTESPTETSTFDDTDETDDDFTTSDTTTSDTTTSETTTDSSTQETATEFPTDFPTDTDESDSEPTSTDDLWSEIDDIVKDLPTNKAGFESDDGEGAGSLVQVGTFQLALGALIALL